MSSAIVLGSVLAVAIAVGLSPLAPLGPVSKVYPSAGIAFDWTVLGIGLVVLIVGLGASTALLAFWHKPQRGTQMDRVATPNLASRPVVGVAGAVAVRRRRAALRVRPGSAATAARRHVRRW